VEDAADGRADVGVKEAIVQPLERMTAIFGGDEGFRPAWWLPGAHGQTIGGRLLRPRALPAFRRERLETPDGDFVDLDHAPGPDTGPVVLLLHGLEGSARRGYAINVYRELAARGVRAVGLNFRGCSGELNRLPRFYHSGDTGDIRFVLDHLRARLGDVPLGAAGFSLGGNALLKYLGEAGHASRVRAAVAVSVPYDLAAGAALLTRSLMGRFYTRRFLASLIGKAEQKADALAAHCDLDRIRRAQTFAEFDDAATAPLHGFAGAEEYYAQSSSGSFVEHIRVPSLLIHAEDDPFVPASAFPAAAVASNPVVQAVVTPGGGHVGFIGGSPWAPDFWAERLVARFLAERLGSVDSSGTGR
jgi:uncharacterized protein